jgi:hypothetical protein
MKKVAIFVSTILLFAGMTFGQTPQTQDKSKPAAAKTEAPVKKDAKGCEKTCTHKGKSCSHDAKAGCCAKKGADSKKDVKTTTPTTPEKK